jgi:hypothetical protein
MVTADITQLSTECNAWNTTLRSNREELATCKNNLQQLAAKPLDKKKLQDVDHFHNQFHIQLINVHDLKHAIKDHVKIAEWEMRVHDGHFSDATWAAHEDLFDQYTQLEHTLQDLKTDFDKFSTGFA